MILHSKTVRIHPRILFTVIILQVLPLSFGIDARIGLNVDGSGFHRNLMYYVDINDFEYVNCHAALYLELPAALYVNTDELADLRRSGTTTACVTGETNVELFMEKAKGQEVTVCTPLANNSCALQFPIHLRYQYAKDGGGYNRVILPKPKLLLGCPDRIKEYRVSKLTLCSPCVHAAIKWREIPYTMDQEDCIWMVPVGNSSLLTTISYVTLFVTIAAAFFISRTVLKAVPEEHKKEE